MLYVRSARVTLAEKANEQIILQTQRRVRILIYSWSGQERNIFFSSHAGHCSEGKIMHSISLRIASQDIVFCHSPSTPQTSSTPSPPTPSPSTAKILSFCHSPPTPPTSSTPPTPSPSTAEILFRVLPHQHQLSQGNDIFHHLMQKENLNKYKWKIQKYSFCMV